MKIGYIRVRTQEQNTERRAKEYVGFDDICKKVEAGEITATMAMKILGKKKSPFYRRIKN